MNEVYFSQLVRTENGWIEKVKEQVCSPERALVQFQLDTDKITVVGTGWAAYPQFAEQNLPLAISEITLPSAKYMLALAEQEIAKGNVKLVDEIEPVYLRNEVTWKKLPHKQ
jgi:putative M22-like peptidase